MLKSKKLKKTLSSFNHFFPPAAIGLRWSTAAATYGLSAIVLSAGSANGATAGYSLAAAALKGAEACTAATAAIECSTALAYAGEPATASCACR